MKDKIIEKIKIMSESELIDLNIFIECIEYKRFKKLLDEKEKIKEMLKSRETSFKQIKSSLQNSAIPRFNTGTIKLSDVIKHLQYEFNINDKNDAMLVLNHMIEAGVLSKTYNDNIIDE